jgi:hypothetical protein
MVEGRVQGLIPSYRRLCGSKPAAHDYVVLSVRNFGKLGKLGISPDQDHHSNRLGTFLVAAPP